MTMTQLICNVSRNPGGEREFSYYLKHPNGDRSKIYNDDVGRYIRQHESITYIEEMTKEEATERFNIKFVE